MKVISLVVFLFIYLTISQAKPSSLPVNYLYLGFPDQAGNLWIASSPSGATNTWVLQNLTVQSQLAPTMIIFDDVLFYAYVSTSGIVSYLTSKDGSTWSGPSYTNFPTSAPVALAVFDGLLYLAGTISNGHILVISSKDGIYWSEQGTITPPTTSISGVSMTSRLQRVFLTFTGDNHSVYITSTKGQSWETPYIVDSPWTMTNQSAGMCEAMNQLMLVATGIDNRIWVNNASNPSGGASSWAEFSAIYDQAQVNVESPSCAYSLNAVNAPSFFISYSSITGEIFVLMNDGVNDWLAYNLPAQYLSNHGTSLFSTYTNSTSY